MFIAVSLWYNWFGSQNVRGATTLSEDLAVASRALSSSIARASSGAGLGVPAAAGDSPKQTRLVLIFLSWSYWLDLFFFTSSSTGRATCSVSRIESLYRIYPHLSRDFFSLPYPSPADFLTQISEANERMMLIMMSVDSLKIPLSVIAIVQSFLKKFSLKVVVIQLKQTT